MQITKKIYLVGGAVRDKLLNLPIVDKDYLAVGFNENDFAHLKKVGKDFPVFLQEDGSELALARVEKKVSGGYNGFSSETNNVTLEDDLKRRDLTINSIAYDEDNDIYIDPYGGREDIQNKILKHTSSAFIEDPLRVLRIARFRAKLGEEWKIDPSTKLLIASMKGELQYLQEDRVYKEIKKVFEYNNSYLFFQTLKELDVLENIFPSIFLLTTHNGKFEMTMDFLKSVSKQTMTLQLTALYYYIIESEKKSFEELIDIKLPKKTLLSVATIIRNSLEVNKLDTLDDTTIIEWFKSFKNKKELLEDILYFNRLLIEFEKKTNYKTTQELNSQLILQIFNEICSYSPQKWIESFATKPSNQKIASHLQSYNLQVLCKYKQLYKKLFIL